MNYTGEEIPENKGRAADLFEEASQQGHAPSECLLGTMYAQGDGIPEDLAKSVKLYQRSAARGHDEAIFNLAVMYFNGFAVNEDKVSHECAW